jgi:uncharacterized protein (DUF983 family)
MNVTRTQIISRGLRIHCPNCGSPELFKKGRWFTLNRSCPRCGLRLERDEGGFLGAISLNYGFTVVCFLVPVLVLYLNGILSGFTASMIAGAGAIIVPILFYRHSRSLWLMNYYLVLPQHLPANRSTPVPAGQDENS